MQNRGFFSQKTAGAALCIVLLLMAQQVCAAPVVSWVQGSGPQPGQVLRRVARMTPLWRSLSSKPFGAYCQSNIECFSGLCRAGHCTNISRVLSEAVKS
ncbi:liver-expressed antimicrobial peptide 2 [Thalassophryne amazonica]|uniref:liver-expressed antimicrobial peptide 2 n=1 Tax=Thalassophryne amazonica TaxID=390379 RepID=UPI001471F1A9|nr:liver-expressed antimicrobial peptide 2 [Thalassophryne amazonica]